MGHHIEALITRQKVNKESLKILDIPILKEGEFNIIPLNICHSIFLGKKWGTHDECGDYFGGVELICIKTIERMAQELNLTEYTIIGTDYHAGIGNQASRVYKNSKLIKVEGVEFDNGFGLKGIDINSALRAIGVIRKKGVDEFDTINLGKYRNFENHFEKYEMYCDD